MLLVPLTLLTQEMLFLRAHFNNCKASVADELRPRQNIHLMESKGSLDRISILRIICTFNLYARVTILIKAFESQVFLSLIPGYIYFPLNYVLSL